MFLLRHIGVNWQGDRSSESDSAFGQASLTACAANFQIGL